MSFRVSILPRAEREFARLPKPTQQQFYSALRMLEEDPFSLDVQKIAGTREGYRLRVGRWRILFSILFHENHIRIIDLFLKKGEQDYRKRMRLLR